MQELNCVTISSPNVVIHQQAKVSQQPKEKDEKIKELASILNKVENNNPLINPFPYRQNPYAGEAHQHTLNWMSKFGLDKNAASYAKFLRSKFFELTGPAYPDCPRNVLIPISDWIAFLHENDDVVENMDSKTLSEFIEQNMKVMRNQAQPTGDDLPLTWALYDLTRRIEVIAKERFGDINAQIWMERFVKVDQKHFDSTRWEADCRENGIGTPAMKDYQVKRADTGAVKTVLTLIELSKGIFIPNEIHDQFLAELEIAFNKIICDSNDVRSCLKELEACFVNNLVFVLKQERNCGLEEAVNESHNMHNEQVARFEQLKYILCQKLNSEDCDPRLKQYKNEILQYIEGMREWMGAHYVFAKTSARYLLSSA